MIRSSAKRKVKQGSSYSRSIGVSSAFNSLDLVALLRQLGDNAFPLVALNLPAPVHDDASGPASLFGRSGEFPKTTLVQGQVADCNKKSVVIDDAWRVRPRRSR